MNVRFLIQLFHHGWNVPVLAQFPTQSRGSGVRFVVLAQELNISRDTLRTTLRSLVALGLIMKNPGYGHPMRAEYLLTESGELLMPHVSRLYESYGELPLLRKKWTAPTIESIYLGHTRFNEIRASLLVTPRALTTSLRALDDSAVVSREVQEDYPPSAIYELSRDGERVARQINAVCLAIS